MRRDPDRPKTQERFANLRRGSRKQFLTAAQIAMIADLWGRGLPAHEIAREAGLTQSRLLARLGDQLAAVCPKRGRGILGLSRRRKAGDAVDSDPSPREIRLAAAVLRRSWPACRWGDVAPPDGERLGRTAQFVSIRRGSIDHSVDNHFSDGGSAAE